MDQLPCNFNSKQRNQKEEDEDEEEETNKLTEEWGVNNRSMRNRIISRDNTFSRRFSTSNLRSFREDTSRSFRSNFTISSTASSPGYHPSLRDEIDPSTYSFTTALKALQARTGCVLWECMSPDGLGLNSKWNEAEKYICNPLSGEVPMECLSAKTLSGRSLLHTTRITMSAPLFYPSQLISTTPSLKPNLPKFPVLDKKLGIVMTRDVGIQSTPPEFSSGSTTPTSMPSRVEVKETEEEEKKEEKADRRDDKKEGRSMCRWKQLGGGCLSMSWMRIRHREKKKVQPVESRKRNMFLCAHFTGC